MSEFCKSLNDDSPVLYDVRLKNGPIHDNVNLEKLLNYSNSKESAIEMVIIRRQVDYEKKNFIEISFYNFEHLV